MGNPRVCDDADLDNDTDVDAADLAIFQGCMSGDGVTASDECLQRSFVPACCCTSYTLHGRPVDLLPDGKVLMYVRARYYDPEHARWLQRDPKGYVDGPNLYQAFGNNPAAVIDPMGTTGEVVFNDSLRSRPIRVMRRHYDWLGIQYPNDIEIGELMQGRGPEDPLVIRKIPGKSPRIVSLTKVANEIDGWGTTSDWDEWFLDHGMTQDTYRASMFAQGGEAGNPTLNELDEVAGICAGQVKNLLECYATGPLEYAMAGRYVATIDVARDANKARRGSAATRLLTQVDEGKKATQQVVSHQPTKPTVTRTVAPTAKMTQAVVKTAVKGADEFAELGVDTSKGFSTFADFKKTHGVAGQRQAWHHIVEQTRNAGKFPAEAIHNPGNLIKLPHGKGTIHAKISGYYSSKQAFTGGKTVRDWISEKSFSEQFQFGIDTIKDFGGGEYLPPHLR